MDKRIVIDFAGVDIEEVLKRIKDYAFNNYVKGSEGYHALMDIYCLLVTTYIYKGW